VKIDGAGLDRILILTFGQEATNNIDRNELAARLSWIASAHGVGRTLRTKRGDRQKIKERILRTAERLKNDVADYYAGLDPALPEPQRHCAALDRLIAEVTDGLPGLEEMFGQKFSEFEVIVHNLRSTFERYFNQRASYSRNPTTGEIKGAFIDFAVAALNAMQIANIVASKSRTVPYSRHAIADALTRLNTAANRQKPRRATKNSG
jgi:hypothetical protein